jgi:hypothetical protein
MEQISGNKHKECQARSNEIIAVFSKVFLENIHNKITTHLEMQEQDGIYATSLPYQWSEKDLV